MILIYKGILFMSYNSLPFALLVAVAFILYYVLPKVCRPVVLLAASLFFYSCFDVKYFIFLLISAVTTYVTALIIPRSKKKNLDVLFIGVCIGLNVAMWFIIKELPWALSVVSDSLIKNGNTTNVPMLSVLVPVGVSYFTLQAIGYLVDVSKEKIEPEKRFFKYFLFLSWFPAIVQGPISRYDKLAPQLYNKNKISFDGIQNGLLLILIGLVKKVVVADRLAIFVNHCFKEYENLGGIILYLGAVGYAIQLFTDFSGCVDLCRGVSKLFGIDLINNFNRPYFACSIKEFWGKWHISLSTWLKDYVYIPLGGNRKGTVRRYLNVIITFLVSGLWHGAGFTFFIWGLMHALYQIIGDVLMPVRRKVKAIIGIKEGSLSERIYQTVVTFNLVTLAWIFFRSADIPSAFTYIGNMFTVSDPWVLFDKTLFSFGVSQNAFTLIFIHLIVLFIVEWRTKSQEDCISKISELHLPIRWAVFLALILDVIMFGAYGSGFDMAGFLYGGF